MAVDDFINAGRSGAEAIVEAAYRKKRELEAEAAKLNAKTSGGGSSGGSGGEEEKEPGVITAFNKLASAENTLKRAYQRYARFVNEVPVAYADYVKKAAAKVTTHRRQLEAALGLQPETLQGAHFTESSVAAEAFEKEYKRLGESIAKLQSIVSPAPEERAQLRQLVQRRSRLERTAKNMLGIELAPTTTPESVRWERFSGALANQEKAIARYQELQKMASRFRRGGQPPVLKEELGRAKIDIDKAKAEVERYGGTLSKFRQFTDQIHRTVLKSRWAFLTLSTVTAIVVSRVIGYLFKLGSAMARLPWEAMKRGAKAFYELGRAVLFTRDRFKQYEIALNGVLHSSTKATQISAFAKQYAAKYPAMYEDIMKAFTLLSQNPQIKPFIKEADTKQLKEFMDIIQMLGKLNPEQGVAGARFAVSEAFAGNFRSLMMRFNLPVEVLAGTIGKERSDLLDPKTLLRALKAYTDLNGGAQLLAASANTLKTHLGNLADKWKMFLDLVGQSGAYESALSFFKRLDELWGKLLSSPVGQQFGGMLSGIITQLSKLGQRLLNLFPTNAFSSFSEFEKAFKKFISTISTGLQKVENLFTTLYGYLSNILVPLFVDLGMMVGKAFISGIIKAVFNSPDLNNIKVENIGPGIPDFSKTTVNQYDAIMKSTLSRIKEGFPKVWAQIKKMLDLHPINLKTPVNTTFYDNWISKLKEVNTQLDKLGKHPTPAMEAAKASVPADVFAKTKDILFSKASAAYAMTFEHKNYIQAIIDEFHKQAKKLPHNVSPDMFMGLAISLVDSAQKAVDESFKKKPIIINFAVALPTKTISSQLKKAWDSIREGIFKHGTVNQKQFETAITMSLTATATALKARAKNIWEYAVAHGETFTEKAKQAFKYYTGTTTNVIEKYATGLQLLVEESKKVPAAFKDAFAIKASDYIKKAGEAIDGFKDKLTGMAQQLDKLHMQKFMIDINQSRTLLGLQAQMAKTQGKPFNLGGELYRLGRQVSEEAVMAETPQGQIGYLQKAKSLFTQAFNIGISTKNNELMSDAFRQIKFVMADLADLQKETTGNAIDKLIEALKSNTGSLGKLTNATSRLADNMDKAVGISGKPFDIDTALNVTKDTYRLNSLLTGYLY